jgi:hypothetical protein
LPKARSQQENAMSSQLWPIEINCDAPSYLVVQACERLRFLSPLDVRWCRMSNFLHESNASLRLWNFLFTKNQLERRTCTCGELLPVLEGYAFTFACGKVLNYGLGQCPKCRTVFWEEGIVPAEVDTDHSETM